MLTLHLHAWHDHALSVCVNWEYPSTSSISLEVKPLAGNLKVEGSILPWGDALFLIEGNICSEFKSWKMQSLKNYVKKFKSQINEPNFYRRNTLVYPWYEETTNEKIMFAIFVI